MNKITIATHHRTLTTDIYTHMEKQWEYTLRLESKIQRRLKSIRENKMADVNEFELLLFAPLKYTR
jgi:hypothetical protein